MTEKRQPRLKRTKLHGGHHTQATPPGKVDPGQALIVEYVHNGQAAKSQGLAGQGVPLPAGAKVTKWEVA